MYKRKHFQPYWNVLGVLSSVRPNSYSVNGLPLMLMESLTAAISRKKCNNYRFIDKEQNINKHIKKFKLSSDRSTIIEGNNSTGKINSCYSKSPTLFSNKIGTYSVLIR